MSEDYSNLFATEAPRPAAPESPSTDTESPATVSAMAERVSTGRWMWEGLRASVCLRPRVSERATPGPWQLFFLLGLSALIVLGVDWLSFVGAVRFRIDGWFAEWGLTLMLLWCLWCAVPVQQPAGTTRGGRVLAWLALNSMATLPLMLLVYAFLGAEARIEEPDEMPIVAQVAFLVVTVVWAAVIEWRLARFAIGRIWRMLAFLLWSSAIAAVFFTFSDVDVWDNTEVDVIQQEDPDAGGASTPDEEQVDPEDDGEDDENFGEPSNKLLEARLGSFIDHSA